MRQRLQNATCWGGIGLALAFSYSCVGVVAQKSAAALATSSAASSTYTDEFVGPFSSWANVRSDYGALGDGTTDDTQAIQNGLNDIGSAGKPTVLFFPSGTYRISSTLNLKYKMGISMIGEDPTTTTIEWAGPSGGIMMLVNGVAYSRWNRITWDGKGTAGIGVAHQWDKVGGYASTALEHSDEIFKNSSKCLEGGIPNGSNDSEVSVWRNQFINCSTAAISVESFNALNWYVWYNSFTDNGIGITNQFLAGNFLVENNLFQGSKIADITTHATYYFSFRNNASIGSQAFYIGMPVGANSAQITIQGNMIVDPVNSTPIQVANLGPILFVDNIIRSQPGASGPVVSLAGSDPGDLISVGNTFTVNNPLSVNGRLTANGDQVVDRNSLNIVVPTLPTVPTNYHRQIFEVPAGATGQAIQAAIQSAAALNGARPVVHIPAGTYSIAQTLTIPANTDLQLVGDGKGATSLDWSGTATGPLLSVEGPSTATVREVKIAGTGTQEGIEIITGDQPGSRIYGQEVILHGAATAGLFADSLDNTHVDLRDLNFDGNQIGIKAVGGASAAMGNPLGGRTDVFTSDSGNNALNYDVSNGADLLSRDAYYETTASGSPTFLHLTGRGTFTLQGAKVALPVNTTMPAIDIQSFTGSASFLEMQIIDINNKNEGMIQTGGAGTNTSVLGLGLASEQGGTFLNNVSSPLANAVISNSQFLGILSLGNPGWMEAPNVGTVDPTFLLSMLAQTRGHQPQLLSNLSSGVTDIRLYGVWTENCATGLHLK